MILQRSLCFLSLHGSNITFGVWLSSPLMGTFRHLVGVLFFGWPLPFSWPFHSLTELSSFCFLAESSLGCFSGVPNWAFVDRVLKGTHEK